ncbi:hypothetical protein [Photobacterium minamisatsumaniensis]|uniref:hypothetical protein n=1 Tax=Photobacterium minamisatsumaniensis TaxID=2910233 RepID=UPI003D095A88
MNTGVMFLIPALLGAQLILTLVLTKGDICPGQRGRVHKTLPVLILGWLIASVFQPIAVLPMVALGYFTLKVKTGKTRDAGPLKVFYAADALAFIAWLGLLPVLTLQGAALSLCAVVLFGSLTAHLLLTQARTRLQAFHRLLPFAGFASAMLSVLCILWLSSSLSETALSELTSNVIGSLLLMVCALLVWAMHLLTGKVVNKWQLVVAACFMAVSASLQIALV